jgi:hypothetical protein
MRTRCQPLFSRDPLQRPVRLTGSPDSGWLADRLLERLSGSQIAEKHPSGMGRRACCANPLGHVPGVLLRPANQLRRLARFTDQMAATRMRNGRSYSKSQMRIDTSCDVAKLAVTLAQGRVLEPER